MVVHFLALMAGLQSGVILLRAPPSDCVGPARLISATAMFVAPAQALSLASRIYDAREYIKNMDFIRNMMATVATKTIESDCCRNIKLLHICLENAALVNVAFHMLCYGASALKVL